MDERTPIIPVRFDRIAYLGPKQSASLRSPPRLSPEVNEGDAEGGPSRLRGTQIGPDQVRPESSDSTGPTGNSEAEAHQASLRRPGLDGAQRSDRSAGPGFVDLLVGENGQADDHRRWRSCRFRTGAHHLRIGRFSGRAELRHRGAPLGDQAIPGKTRLTEDKGEQGVLRGVTRPGVGNFYSRFGGISR